MKYFSATASDAPYTGKETEKNMFDKFEEECGVFGVYGHPEAANLTYLGLYSLQHRGQESCGIVASDGDALRAHRKNGLVSDAIPRYSSAFPDAVPSGMCAIPLPEATM